MIIECSADKFDEIVLKSDKTVLVDFWAPWCGPCRGLASELETFSKKNEDISIVKINVDDNMELASKYLIKSIPTLILFKSGKEEKKISGNQTQDSLGKFIK